MPTAEVEEDLDIDLEKLFEEEIPCAACDNVATWLVGCPHCHDFGCDEHKKQAEEFIKKISKKRGYFLICDHGVSFSPKQAWFRKL